MLGSAEPSPRPSRGCSRAPVAAWGLAEQGAQSQSVRNVVGKLGSQNQLRPWSAPEEGRKTLSCRGWLLNVSFLPSDFWAVLG